MRENIGCLPRLRSWCDHVDLIAKSAFSKTQNAAVATAQNIFNDQRWWEVKIHMFAPFIVDDPIHALTIHNRAPVIKAQGRSRFWQAASERIQGNYDDPYKV